MVLWWAVGAGVAVIGVIAAGAWGYVSGTKQTVATYAKAGTIAGGGASLFGLFGFETLQSGLITIGVMLLVARVLMNWNQRN